MGGKNILHQQIRTCYLCYPCIALQSPVLQFNPYKKHVIGSNLSLIAQKKKSSRIKLKFMKNYTIIIQIKCERVNNDVTIVKTPHHLAL
jgi:hypothetical protein